MQSEWKTVFKITAQMEWSQCADNVSLNYTFIHVIQFVHESKSVPAVWVILTVQKADAGAL